MKKTPPTRTAIAAATLAALVLAGCQKEETPWTRMQAATQPIEIVQDTPENAVKSWWRLRDEQFRLNAVTCKETNAIYKEVASGTRTLAGPMISRFLAPRCEQTTFYREIGKVQHPSETRAIVFAQVRNSTPPTPGHQMTDYEKEAKQAGAAFKYVLTRKADGEPWEIAEVRTITQYNRCGRDPDEDNSCNYYALGESSANFDVPWFMQ
ncbi:hypothetical protein RAN3_3947 [plant metagenome]|uniref:Lipoprotein n=1 Tax=plant metagenome TaxID=1297885 RepID=A0A484V2I9_9ZZZZ